MRLACFSPAFLVVSVLASGCSRESRVQKPELPPLDVVPAGAHDLVRLQYNDVNDVYRAFLVGGAADKPLRLRGVRLALMSDEQIAAGKRPHLVDDGAGPLVLAGPRFKIGILHGVVEQRLDEQAKRKNVVVRTERKPWSPFLTANLIDGKSAWHTPAVHYPPPVGLGPIVGSGGNGPSREAAWDDYRRRYGFLPQAVRLEFEGYALAKDLPKDDPNDDDDARGVVDAGTPARSNVNVNVNANANVDGGPGGARDNRIIGANSGSKAEKARMRTLAEKRKKQIEEAKRKNPRNGAPAMKPTP